jgi:hypothetical protein
MPRPRRPHKASPDEIKITRDGDYAIIVYADESVATTHLKMGSEKLAVMTDEQILDFWNTGIEARDTVMAAYEHVAVEIPIGKPQLKYEERSDQWVPRGNVVKGVVLGSDGSDIEDEFVTVDGKDLTIREFARMMMTFGGWGFRIVFVPDHDIHDEPEVEVREPTDG